MALGSARKRFCIRIAAILTCAAQLGDSSGIWSRARQAMTDRWYLRVSLPMSDMNGECVVSTKALQTSTEDAIVYYQQKLINRQQLTGLRSQLRAQTSCTRTRVRAEWGERLGGRT